MVHYILVNKVGYTKTIEACYRNNKCSCLKKIRKRNYWPGPIQHPLPPQLLQLVFQQRWFACGSCKQPYGRAQSCILLLAYREMLFMVVVSKATALS